MGILGYFAVVGFTHLLLFYSINYYFFSPDDKTRNKIFNEIIDKLIDSLPQVYEGLDPFPVDSEIRSLFIDSDGIHLNIFGKNNENLGEYLRYTIFFDEKSKKEDVSFLGTFEWLFKSHPLWSFSYNQNKIFIVDMLERNYSFYYLLNDQRMANMPNFSDDFSEDLYPLKNPDYDSITNPDVSPFLFMAGKKRLYLNLENHIKKDKLTINFIDKSDGISEFDRELTKKEKSENELAKFLYYLSNSGIIKSLENKKRLDPSFGYTLDYGIDNDDNFYYTLESYDIEVDGVKIEGSEKQEEVYNPVVSDILEKAGATVVKIDPQSRKLYIQNPEISLKDTAKIDVNIPSESKIKLDTTGSSVDINTTGKSIDIDTVGKSVSLSTIGKTVGLNTYNKSITLDTVGKNVKLDVPDGSSVNLKTTDDSGKVKHIDLKFTDENGEEKSFKIDGIGTGDWNNLIKGLYERQGNLKKIDLNSLEEYKVEFGNGDDSIRLLEKDNAKYIKTRNEYIVNEPDGEKDQLGREIQTWNNLYSTNVKNQFIDSYGDTVEIKEGYYANQDSKIKANHELNHRTFGKNEGDIYIAKNLIDLEDDVNEVSKEVEKIEIVKSNLPSELTDYQIVEDVAIKFFDNTDIQNIDNDLDLFN